MKSTLDNNNKNNNNNNAKMKGKKYINASLLVETMCHL